MDVDTYTVYEIIEPVANKSFTTKERHMALAQWKDGDMVFERHFTVHSPTPYTQTYMVIGRQWHNNPDFREED